MNPKLCTVLFTGLLLLSLLVSPAARAETIELTQNTGFRIGPEAIDIDANGNLVVIGSSDFDFRGPRFRASGSQNFPLIFPRPNGRICGLAGDTVDLALDAQAGVDRLMVGDMDCDDDEGCGKELNLHSL